MLKEISGDIWNNLSEDCVVCILTNNSKYYKNNNLCNPMFGGIALEALQRNPNIDFEVAKCINSKKYLLGRDKFSNALLFRFPTKISIYDKISNINLIKESLKELYNFSKDNPKLEIRLPRPGCGIGGLDWENQIKPLCETIFKENYNIIIYNK